MFVVSSGMCASRSLVVCLLLLQVLQELVKLDEQELSNKYKIGIIYCKEGQVTEEEIYNNGVCVCISVGVCVSVWVCVCVCVSGEGGMEY